MTVVVGVDPGLHGALAVVEGTRLVLEDLPLLQVGSANNAKRAELDLHRLFSFLLKLTPLIDHAYIERVSARPGQGVTSMFRFGYASGQVHGVLVALEIPCTFVTPQQWQKAMQVGPGPDAARARAASLYPEHADSFARKLDQHRADAALIATFGHGEIAVRQHRAVVEAA